MKQITYFTGFLLLSIMIGGASAHDDDNLSNTLRQIVENNIAAFNREDVSAAMGFVHTRSPEYDETSDALPNQFEAMDVQTELVDFRYIGHDDEFVVTRVKLKTTEKSGEPFATNIIDTLTVFHQENGEWKLWSDYVLGMEVVQ